MLEKVNIIENCLKTLLIIYCKIQFVTVFNIIICFIRSSDIVLNINWSDESCEKVYMKNESIKLY